LAALQSTNLLDMPFSKDTRHALFHLVVLFHPAGLLPENCG
jgi:hypothetical protein